MNLYKEFCNETFDSSGVLTDFDLCYKENFNFGYDVVDRIADEEPEKTALVWRGSDDEEHVFSFLEIKQWSNRAANIFLSKGIKRGDKVMVVLKRHYEYWFVAVALHKIGAVLLPVTHMLTEQDFQIRIRLSCPKGIIVTPQDSVAEKVRNAAVRENAVCRMWTVQENREGFSNLTEQMKQAPVTLERRDTRTEDPMLLYFTSGTTGSPKGVFHSFTYPLAHIITAKYWQGAQDGGLHFTIAETGWGKASWGKIYGQWIIGSAVMVYDFDTFDPAMLVNIVNRYGVTSFCAPPTIYRYLVRRDIPSMPSLKHASTAGEALSPEVFKAFTAKTGLRLYEGYGQTETVLLLGNFADKEPVDASLGFPSPLFRIELRDRDGAPVKQGEIGEIVVVPKNDIQAGMFMSYLNSELEERIAWRGGVYHTGDAAWQDTEGRFWFHSRFDDIIKTGGYRVGPYEIEKVLLEEETVEECSVIGVPDALRGQAIKAFIVLADGVAPNLQLANRIKNRCNTKLAEYKWIRVVEFVKDLPKTISGKVRPIDLKKRSAAQSIAVLNEEQYVRGDDMNEKTKNRGIGKDLEHIYYRLS